MPTFLFTRLVGDVLVSTAFISYAGPFNQEYRTRMTQSWRNNLKNKEIPNTNNLQVTPWLVDNATVSSMSIPNLKSLTILLI